MKRDAEDSNSGEEGYHNGAGSSKKARVERTFVASWLQNYDWLRFDRSQNLMFCELCLKHGKANTFTEGCQNFRRDNLNKHVRTTDHRSAVEQEDSNLLMETPLALTIVSTTSLLNGGDANGELKVTKDDLPITPNYIAHPPFPYLSSSLKPVHDDIPVNLSVSSTPLQHNATSQQNSMLNHRNGCPDQADEDELVLKIRVANAVERDFIEVELPRDELTFENLLSTMCSELEVDRKLVQKVRKMPDTKVRKDKDVRRLQDFQELELVLTNKAMSESSRNYNQGPAQRHVDVVY